MRFQELGFPFSRLAGMLCQVQLRRAAVVKSSNREGRSGAGRISRARNENRRDAGKVAVRSELKKVTTGLEPAVHVQLKILSARLDRTIEDLLRDAIEDLITMHAGRTGQRS